jgi:hypothetical protein
MGLRGGERGLRGSGRMGRKEGDWRQLLAEPSPACLPACGGESPRSAHCLPLFLYQCLLTSDVK